MIGHKPAARLLASRTARNAINLCLVAFLFMSGGAHAGERLTELKVGPMDCAACRVIVRQSLQSLEGVQWAIVSPSEERVNVTYDDDKISPDDMVAHLLSRGYNAEVRE